MKLLKTVNSLCTPAQIYLFFSVISIVLIALQNTDSHKYCVGNYSCNLQHHNIVFFVFKTLYAVIWTYLLQLLCTKGYRNISWFLVLLPFLLFFILIGLFILMNVMNN